MSLSRPSCSLFRINRANPSTRTRLPPSVRSTVSGTRSSNASRCPTFRARRAVRNLVISRWWPSPARGPAPDAGHDPSDRDSEHRAHREPRATARDSQAYAHERYRDRTCEMGAPVSTLATPPSTQRIRPRSGREHRPPPESRYGPQHFATRRRCRRSPATLRAARLPSARASSGSTSRRRRRRAALWAARSRCSHGQTITTSDRGRRANAPDARGFRRAREKNRALIDRFGRRGTSDEPGTEEDRPRGTRAQSSVFQSQNGMIDEPYAAVPAVPADCRASPWSSSAK